MFFKGVSYIKSIHIRKEVKLAWLVVWAAAAAAGSSGYWWYVVYLFRRILERIGWWCIRDFVTWDDGECKEEDMLVIRSSFASFLLLRLLLV